MTEALRYNSDKPKMSYFMRSFPWMTAAVARVKEFGANKYNDGNWKLGNKPDAEYLDSMFRHMDYFFKGEFYDQDSGCSHLAHAVWNLSALAELNYGDKPIVDEELFRERMAFWAAKKAEKAEEKAKALNEMIKIRAEIKAENACCPEVWVAGFDTGNESAEAEQEKIKAKGVVIPEGEMPEFIQAGVDPGVDSGSVTSFYIPPHPSDGKSKEIRAAINKMADALAKKNAEAKPE